jgi:hypothetical protein
MKFIVTVQRTATQELDIEVEARNFLEAEEIAIAEAPNRDFTNREKTADYASTYSRRVEDDVVK